MIRTLEKLVDVFKWSPDVFYRYGDSVVQNGRVYSCINETGAMAGTPLSDDRYWSYAGHQDPPGEPGPRGCIREGVSDDGLDSE